MSGLVCALALPPAANAADQIYSYEPASPAARSLTQSGLSFVFERGLTGGARIRKVIQTGDQGEATLKGASDKDLGAGGLRAALGKEAPAGGLYEIDPAEDGAAFVNAVCPGAARAWLAIGALKRFRDLTMQTIGRDKDAPAARHCATLAFTFRNEWTLPEQRPPHIRLSPSLRPN